MLQRIDRTQMRFLREIGHTEARALLQFRLAPLESRRDIAILGMLHRIVLGLAPPQAAGLFPVIGAVVEPAGRQRLRYWRPLHDRQISTAAIFASTDVFQRSAFGLARCYNRLPQEIVELSNVKDFQKRLQHTLMNFLESGADNWSKLFSTQWRMMRPDVFHALFRNR